MLEIVTYPAPLLRDVAESIDQIDDDLRTVIDEMIDTMYQGDGVGLAAPQVGLSKKIIVIDDRQGEGPQAFINPEIVYKSDEQEKMEEGCLSLPGIQVDVWRSTHVRVQAMNLHGEKIEVEADGYFARILQHEIDHLNGVLLIDHASSIQRKLMKSKLRRLEKSFV